MMPLAQIFRTWLDHKLKNGVYELQGMEIVCGRGLDTEYRLQIPEVKAWQICPEMGFNLVTIDLANGQQRRCIDRYDDLTGILRRIAPEKETHA